MSPCQHIGPDVIVCGPGPMKVVHREPHGEGPPKRVRRQSTKGWRMPPGAVYVGRGSKWANPFRLCEEWPTHDEVIRMYRDLIDHGEAWWSSLPGTRWEQRNRWRVHPSQRNWLDAAVIRRELAGRDLMCWCPLDVPCHADVLLALANGEISDG